MYALLNGKILTKDTILNTVNLENPPFNNRISNSFFNPLVFSSRQFLYLRLHLTCYIVHHSNPRPDARRRRNQHKFGNWSQGVNKNGGELEAILINNYSSNYVVAACLNAVVCIGWLVLHKGQPATTLYTFFLKEAGFKFNFKHKNSFKTNNYIISLSAAH